MRIKHTGDLEELVIRMCVLMDFARKDNPVVGQGHFRKIARALLKDYHIIPKKKYSIFGNRKNGVIRRTVRPPSDPMGTMI